MPEIRTYVKAPFGRQATSSLRRVDAERMRVDWRTSDGALIDSALMTDREALELAASITAFVSPAPVPVPVPVPPTSMPPPPGPLTWSDDFATADWTKWSRYNSPGHARNGLRLPSTWSVQAVDGASGMAAVCEATWISGKDAAIALIPSWITDPDRTFLINQFTAANGAVTAGGMSARKDGAKFGQLYGRFECRAKFAPDPAGKMSGLALLWPKTGGNLEFGELDFAESLRNTDPHRHPMYAFMHWPHAASGSEQTRWVIDVAGDEWNTYTLDWFPDRLVEYVNGREVGRETDRAKIPTAPFTPCVQLDCFSNGPIARQRACYDYFRVWSAG